MNEKILNALMDQGFSALESRVYVHLLESQQDETGYSVAKAVGKPVANVYKVLDSLKKRGAALESEHTKGRQYRAIAVADFLDLERSKRETRFNHLLSLAQDIQVPNEFELLYNIDDVENALVLAKRVIHKATKVLLIDVAPKLFNEIIPLLEEKIDSQEIVIYIKSSRPVDIEGVINVNPKMEAPELTDTPNSWIEVSADSNHYLLANFSKDGSAVKTGIYCQGASVGYKLHSGLAHEIMVTQLSDAIANSSDVKLQNAFKQITHETLWLAGTIEAFNESFD